MQKKWKTKSFFYSLSLHLVLLFIVVFIFSVKKMENFETPGKKIFAYLSNDLRLKPLRNKNNILIGKRVFLDQNKSLSKRKTETTGDDNLSSFDNELLIKLHDLIQQNISYPHDLFFNEFKKTTIIRFVLFPDGHLENIQVANSSGINRLDQISCQALAKVEPVKFAAQYLTAPKKLEVAVDFYRS
jgi:hypothetical protein